MPDLGLVLPGGPAGFFEVKVKQGRLSDAQSEMLPRLENAGARCAVVRSIERCAVKLLRRGEWKLGSVRVNRGGASCGEVRPRHGCRRRGAAWQGKARIHVRMTASPTLAEQVEAVAWALTHVTAMGESAQKLAEEIEDMRRGLEAAVETLRTWEFAQETLR